MPRDTADDQLTFNVLPHPRAMVGDDPWLLGEAQGKIAFRVGRDFNPGERFLCTIADEDGQIIHSTHLEVASIAFPPLKLEGETVGTTRLHKLEQDDEDR